MNSYKCKQCSKPTFHYEQWDSYFCVICNTWNEDECGDTECSYCVNRPDIPLAKDIHSIFLEANKDIGFDAVSILVEDYLEV